jgi:surfeit locus 1 family protein
VRLGAFSFNPRLAPTIAAVAMIALTLWLGRWQTHRAAEKEERQALFDARLRETPVQLTGSVPSAEALLYRRVIAHGRWVPEGQIFIDNQVHEGRAGFYVVTPLRLDGLKDAVLVNRGWIVRGAEYPRAPDAAISAEMAEVDGLATLPPKRFLELSGDTVSGNVWQNLSIDRYRARTSMVVLPVVVLAEHPGPGLVAIHETPDAGVAKHREYALTWFSLAATAAVLWIALNLRKAR